MKFSEVRNKVYNYHGQSCPYIFQWPWYSYRRYKVIFLTECASFLVFILLKTPITANALTMLYLILGIFAGILLALPSKMCVLIAIGLLFSKPILDWSDGCLARIRKQTSITGDLLDDYTAGMSWVIMWAGLGIYLGNSFSSIFYYLAPLVPTIFAIDIYRSVREQFVYHYFTKPEFRKKDNGLISANKTQIHQCSTIRKFKEAVDKCFQPNARTIDMICLMLVIEQFSSMRIFWYFYCAFLIWQVMTFVLRLFIASRGGWAETELKNLQKTLYG